MLIETDGLATVEQGRGRFRSYLLGAMKHFLTNEWHRAQTQKRGGRFRFIEGDPVELEARYSQATPGPASPEAFFDREWALEIVGRALKTLRDEMSLSGKAEQFETLKGSLTGRDDHSRSEIAARLGMSEGAVKVSIHRLRGRYRGLLREAIAETVDNQADLEDEMRYLASVLRHG
jgi:RNA polymerase sigma-70 factor (ECF subfamily)